LTEETRTLTAISFMLCFFTFRIYIMIPPVAQNMQHQIAKWLQK